MITCFGKGRRFFVDEPATMPTECSPTRHRSRPRRLGRCLRGRGEDRRRPAPRRHWRSSTIWRRPRARTWPRLRRCSDGGSDRRPPARHHNARRAAQTARPGRTDAARRQTARRRRRRALSRAMPAITLPRTPLCPASFARSTVTLCRSSFLRPMRRAKMICEAWPSIGVTGAPISWSRAANNRKTSCALHLSFRSPR